MSTLDPILLECELVRSVAREWRLRAAEARDQARDLHSEHLRWHRDACALVEGALELARERVRIIWGVSRWDGSTRTR
jgi:hypothetical protein